MNTVIKVRQGESERNLRKLIEARKGRKCIGILLVNDSFVSKVIW